MEHEVVEAAKVAYSDWKAQQEKIGKANGIQFLAEVMPQVETLFGGSLGRYEVVETSTHGAIIRLEGTEGEAVNLRIRRNDGSMAHEGPAVTVILDCPECKHSFESARITNLVDLGRVLVEGHPWTECPPRLKMEAGEGTPEIGVIPGLQEAFEKDVRRIVEEYMG